MPANTPIYNFPYPLGTDPVAQGDNDIRALAEDVETVLSTQVGLIKVNTTNFVNTSTITVDNVFTNNFTNYRLLISYRPNTTATGSIEMQLRAGGANLSLNSYVTQGVSQTASNAPVANNGGPGTTGFYVSNFYSATDFTSNADIMLFNPQKPAWTGYLASCAFDWAGPGYFYRTQNGFYAQTTVADGFRIVPSAAITGTIRVYGWRD